MLTSGNVLMYGNVLILKRVSFAGVESVFQKAKAKVPEDSFCIVDQS
jgi:hypothetical protein